MTDSFCLNCPLKRKLGDARLCNECRREMLFHHSTAFQYNRLGAIAYLHQEFAAAVECYRAAIEAHRDGFSLELTFNLGLAQYRCGQYEGAIEAFSQVIDSDPLPEAIFMKALVLRRLEQEEKSRKYLRWAAKKGSQSAICELSEIQIRHDREMMDHDAWKDSPEKRLAYLKGRLSNPSAHGAHHEAALLVNAGNAAAQLGDTELARRYLAHACRIDTTSETATSLAEFVLDCGDQTESTIAEAGLRQALRLDGRHARTHLCLGRLLHLRGESEQAYQSFRSALRESPQDLEILYVTAELAAELGNISYCLTLIKKIEMLTENDYYWLDRAQELLRSIGG